MTDKELIKSLKNRLKVEKNKTDSLAENLKLAEEKIAFLERQLFGRKKESMVHEGQMNLLEKPVVNETEPSSDEKKTEETTEEETITVESYSRRKKSVGNKKETLDQFPQDYVHYELSEDEQICQDCHHHLTHLGECTVNREVVFVPASIRCTNHIQHTYTCHHCSSTSGIKRFVKSTVPSQPLKNSYGSASVIAETVYQKYELKVPAYRQENHWKKMGLSLSRATICDWHIKVCDYYLGFIYDALQKKIQEQTIVHADETSFRVLESQKEKTFYWVLQSSKHEKQFPIIYFSHKDGRKGDMFKEIIGDFKGIVHCDMYSVYRSTNRKVPEIVLAGCWAHLRRKFYEADLVADEQMTLPATIWKMIDEIFTLESQWKGLEIKERHKKRKSILKAKIDAVFTFIDQCAFNSNPKGKFNKALEYARNHREHFYTVLTDGRIELSNNAAERSIKTIVMGRKNQLFATSFKGAQAGAILLTLIETAKLNGLNGQEYIKYLLTHLPNEYILQTMDIDKYMPWSEGVKAACGNNNKAKNLIKAKAA